ncbi:MAG: TlpA disulfide reductase family protein [Pseudomonadota bacterium]
MNKKPVIIVLTLLAWAGIAAVFLTRESDAPMTSFTTLAGEKTSLQEMRGKVVLVNFWATTCPPCAREMPRLAEAYRKYHGRGYETVAVAMSYDPPLYVKRFTEQYQLPFKMVLDADGTIAAAFADVNATPTSYLIDRQGRIVRRVVGELEFPAFEALLEKELAKG